MLAVSFRAEPHPDFPVAGGRATHCALLGRARRGETVQVRAGQVSCPLARRYLGLEKPTEAGVVRALRAWGDVADEAAGQRFLGSGWQMEPPAAWMLCYPLAEGELLLAAPKGTALYDLLLEQALPRSEG